jgi:thiol-disulfide isomerase/thioredoxin
MFMDALFEFTECDVDRAVETARARSLPLFVDFWSPGCKGCERMEADTYARNEVRRFVADRFVAIKYDTSRPGPQLKTIAGSTPLMWTPTLVVLDASLREFRRVVGFAPPGDLMDELGLGLALLNLYHGRVNEALDELRGLATPGISRVAAEAAYWTGVAAFRKEGRSVEALAREWRALDYEHPASVWRTRADVFAVTDVAALRR